RRCARRWRRSGRWRVRDSRLLPPAERYVDQVVGAAEIARGVERLLDLLARQHAGGTGVFDRCLRERDPVAQGAIALGFHDALRFVPSELRGDGAGERFGHQRAAGEIEVATHAILVDLEAGEGLANV